MEGTDKGMGNPNTTGEVRCGTILKVAGPLIVATGMSDVEMFDVVRVSEKRLIGEVIELRGDKASIQVYEETGRLRTRRAGLQHRRAFVCGAGSRTD